MADDRKQSSTNDEHLRLDDITVFGPDGSSEHDDALATAENLEAGPSNKLADLELRESSTLAFGTLHLGTGANETDATRASALGEPHKGAEQYPLAQSADNAGEPAGPINDAGESPDTTAIDRKGADQPDKKSGLHAEDSQVSQVDGVGTTDDSSASISPNAPGDETGAASLVAPDIPLRASSVEKRGPAEHDSAIESRNGSDPHSTGGSREEPVDVAQAPELTVNDAAGTEDTAIALGITSALTDTDGSETLAITVSGVPAGATLSAGTENGGGTWTLAPADLAGLTITPPADSGDDFTLTVTATSTETANGDTAQTVGTIDVNVAGGADAPTLTVNDAAGAEDAAIAIDITSALTDTDGSETLAITIDGVPAGAVLSAGTDNGGGTWTLAPADLAGLTITPPADSGDDFTLTVTATSTETANGDTAQTVGTIDVNVAGGADASTLTVNDAAGAEDAAIALDITSALTDTDGSETLAITIDGVPTGAVLSAGTDSGGGSWRLTPGDLAGLTITPPADSGDDFTLTVTATSTETANGDTAQTVGTIDVGVAGGADAPTLTVNDASGAADQAIAIDITSALTDTDGSETLAITIDGVPAGAVLSAGTDNGGGSWTLAPADLAGLTITPPTGSADDFTLSVSATSTDEGGDTATSVQNLAVQVNAANDDPVNISGSGGADSLAGGSGDDTLSAGDGDDTLIGGAGDDVLYGERGNDLLDGGGGDDVFVVAGSSHGTDTFLGGDGEDVVQGGSGADVIRVTSNFENLDSIERIDGGAGFDRLLGTGGEDVIDLSSGPELNGIERIDAGYGNDTVIGTGGDDVLYGDRGDDLLGGGAGDDVFVVAGSSHGTDTFLGGDGEDVVQGGSGADVIRVTSNFGNLDSIERIDGGAGFDRLLGTGGEDVIDLSAGPELQGIERIDAGYGNDTVIGTGGDDVLYGDRGDDLLGGGAGDDVFVVAGSSHGTDTFLGGDGEDVVQGGSGADVIRVTSNFGNLDSIERIDGGAGFDRLLGTGSNDVIDLSAGPELQGIERIDAGYGNDTVIGTGGDDVLYGDRGDDLLDGGAGDDVFVVAGSSHGTDTFLGGDGEDVVQGGSGADVIRVTSNFGNLDSIERIDGGAGFDRLLGTGSNDVIDLSAGPELQGIERIDAGYGNDTVIGTGGDDVLYGDRGDDLLDGGAGDDVFVVAGSSHGTDTFLGGDGEDVVQGGSGADVIRVTSNFGNLDSIERIDGGAGFDRIIGTGSNDVIDLSSGPELNGIERIDAGYGNDTVIGTGGDDVLYGDRGDDLLGGGAGDDVFVVAGSSHGTDTFLGGDGEDVVQGGSGADVIRVTSNFGNLDSIERIDGGAGFDRLLGTGSNDVIDLSAGPELQGIERIDAGYGNDTVIGTGGDDVLYGDRGDDSLVGGDGDDTLDGGRDDDTLAGGAGDDVAYGQAGNDLFVFGEQGGEDSVYGGGGGGWTDVISLDGVDVAALAPDWLSLTSGTVDETGVDYTVLSEDAAGTVTLNDGSVMAFEGIERIEW